MRKKLLSLLVLLAAAVMGAWADNLYLEVDGTSATLKFGDAGSNPCYTVDQYGDASWSGSNYKNVTTITVDASCASHGETILKYLFSGCSALTTINGLENLKTSGVTNMNGMFLDCSSLATIDLSGWNTASVTNMASMFEGCSSLTNIYVGDNWNTASVEDSDGMFHNCTSLPNWNSQSPVTDKTNAHTGDGGYLIYKAPFDYALTVDAENNLHGTIAFFMDGKKVTGAYKADENKTVTMTVSPEEGYVVGSVTAAAYTTWASARRKVPTTIPMLGNITLAPVEGVDTAWTFTMPAASVLASCEYTPIAVIATAPEAVDSIVAGENKAIISAGTVANIQQSSDVQGTLKYFATTNANMTAAQAASSNGWVETLPTAAVYTDAYANGLTVYVWYYIQAATGYADSQLQRIEVSLLGNLFNLNLKPSKSDKISVEVDGQARAVANDKVGDIKLNSNVKLKANTGYIFRQVEATKTKSPQ